MSSLKELVIRAEEIRKKYEELNAKDGREAWGTKDYAIGFVGDVGDLMKQVVAKENARESEDTDGKLAHELADCLWSILILASQYGIDLDKEFLSTMDDIDDKISGATT